MGPTVRVATINLLKSARRWPERLPLVAAGLAELQPDLIGLQEVIFRAGGTTAHDLARELGGYEVVAAPKTGRHRRAEGVAVLSRLPIREHESLPLVGGEGRVAQFVRVEAAGERPLRFANGHYLWRPLAHRTRARQVEQVLAHLGRGDPAVPLVVGGDFNATPESPAIAAIRRAMTSAHAATHGGEPDSTCPSPLRSGRRVPDALFNFLLDTCSNRPEGPWRATLDYLFVGPGVRVLDCQVCLNQPAPTDPTLYPSDHFGLIATLEVAPLRGRGETDAARTRPAPHDAGLASSS